jgi:tetratricopeptide (TPR) repeat protein
LVGNSATVGNINRERSTLIRQLVSCYVGLALILTLTGPAVSQSVAGGYLAGQLAASESDFEAAAQYFTKALARDPNSPNLMEGVIVSQLALGRIDRAEPIAKLLEARGLRSQSAQMAIIAGLFAAEDYEAFLARDVEAPGIGPLMDGLLQAWAQVGAGNSDAAMRTFDRIAKEPGLRGFALGQI